jgi:hypothetical protein
MRRLLPALSFNCSHPQILSAMVSATSLGPVQQLTYRTLVRPPAHPAPRHHLLAQGSFDDRYELPPPAPASSSQPAAVLTTSSLHAVGRDKVYRATQNAAKALAWCGSTSPPPSSDGVLIPRAVSRLPPQRSPASTRSSRPWDSPASVRSLPFRPKVVELTNERAFSDEDR